MHGVGAWHMSLPGFGVVGLCCGVGLGDGEVLVMGVPWNDNLQWYCCFTEKTKLQAEKKCPFNTPHPTVGRVCIQCAIFSKVQQKWWKFLKWVKYAP